MKTPTEAEITRDIRKLLKGLGVFHWKVWQGPMSSPKGVSDIIGIAPGGQFLAIEIKGKGKKPTPLQQQFLEAVKEDGGIAIVAYSVEDVIKGLGVEGRFLV